MKQTSRIPSPDRITLNLRTLAAPQSGVQRYARELNLRLDRSLPRVAPRWFAQGIGGHLWEQLLLPWLCRGRLLFSPGNTGPWLCRQQVVTIHDATTFDCTDAFTGLFGRWYRWLLPRLAHRCLGVITVSHFSRDRLAATLGIDPGKIAVVYNGVTPPPATPSTRTLEKTRSQLNLPKRFLLFVGSRDPRKNRDGLVTAFERLHEPNLHLVLVGGSNEQVFKAGSTGRISNQVHVLGHVAEPTLECLYHLAEGFVFPSLYEGFGLPPLEAMARGCPVICSDATCLPEVCGPAFEEGGACLYFSPHRIESITSTLQKFITLPAEAKIQMIEAGRRQAGLYQWDRCTRETTAALQHFQNARPATAPVLLKKREVDSS